MTTMFRSAARVLGWLVVGVMLGTTALGHAQDLLWAKKAGGPATDEGYGIAVDSAGNSYVTGRFQGTSTFGPGEAGETALASGGLVDIFVAKYDLNGSLVWVKRAGGEGTNEGHAIAVDGNGNSYATGFFQNTATFGPGETNETTFVAQGGNADIFIAKYDPNGNLLWAKQAGSGTGDVSIGGFAEQGLGIGIDGNGAVYVTGFFQSTTVVFGPGEANQTLINVPGGGREIFLAKFDNADGALVWVAHAGGVGDDEGHALAVDSAGNSYLTGSFQNTATFGASPNTATVTSAAAGDIFVAKYNTSGDLVWVKRAGGGSTDEGQGIAVDTNGRSYVTGSFTGIDVTFGPGEINQTLLSAGHGNDADIFIASYYADGSLAWAKRAGSVSGAGGPSLDKGTAIATDGSGNTYVTGFFNSTATFGPGEALQTTLTAGGVQEDIFVAAYSPTGALAWARKAGGTNRDEGYGVAISNREAHVTGRIQGANVIFGLGETNETTLSTSASDIFVAKFKGPVCGDGQVSFGETCDDGNTANGDGCDSTCQIETICGDGIVAGEEACDQGAANGAPGSCCSAECAFVAPGTECRAGDGACDVAETCSGISAACPADSFASSTTVCRAAAGTCDVAETCDGASTTCPADVLAGAGAACRESAGVCDVAETCDGASTACPTDEFVANTVQCRAGAGLCDPAETCTGSSATCPDDAFASPDTECRPGNGACDAAEHCTGSSGVCPADALATAGAICHPSAGGCDAPETCDGVSSSCPADVIATVGTVCRASLGVCDHEETCDGASSTCPPDVVAPPTTECRADTDGDACNDVPEFCDGTTGACPPDSPVVITMDCTVNGIANQPCQGGDGKDTIVGTAGRDVIRGGKGNDVLRGQQGDDIICGEEGRDQLIGALGNDTLIGGEGRDVLRGNGSDDILSEETDHDRLLGGADVDTLIGGDGADRLEGGDGNDKLIGNFGDDLLLGGPGKDRLSGDVGDDDLDGGSEDDKLDGGPGADMCTNGEKVKGCEF